MLAILVFINFCFLKVHAAPVNCHKLGIITMRESSVGKGLGLIIFGL